MTNQELLAELAETFAGRAITQGWKPNTVTYTRHALEFFIGAQACLQALGNKLDLGPAMLLISVGRDPVKMFLKKGTNAQSSNQDVQS